MATAEDLYEVLGLAEDADEASIKKAQLMVCLGKALKGYAISLGVIYCITAGVSQALDSAACLQGKHGTSGFEAMCQTNLC